MKATEQTLQIGTRNSRLARWQAEHVRALLQRAWPGLPTRIVFIRSLGDRQQGALRVPAGGGIFTAALTEALLAGHIDLAVHSLKDLPTATPTGLTFGAILRRGSAADALVSRDGETLAGLPAKAVIGTGSPRRAAQLRRLRPDLTVRPVRGNVHTRVARVMEADDPCAALLLAEAGLLRLGLAAAIRERLSLRDMVPAPGQGALAVQCRDEASLLQLLAPLEHAPTRQAVSAERAFLAALATGCSAPVAAHAQVCGGTLRLHGRVLALDGSRRLDLSLTGAAAAAERTGQRLAQRALRQGAAELTGAR